LVYYIIWLQLLELSTALAKPGRLNKATHLTLNSMQAFWLIRLAVLSWTWIVTLRDHPWSIARDKLLGWIILIDCLSLDVRNLRTCKWLRTSSHKAFVWMYALPFLYLSMLGILWRFWNTLFAVDRLAVI
jgi:hypothetical protein